MRVDTWFLVLFALLLIAGPVTQLLQLIAPNLHHKLGLTEAKAIQPEFEWFLLDERAIAIADLTYLTAGIAFVWLALAGNHSALIFGIYTCACCVFISVLAISRWLLLEKHALSPLSRTQLPFYFVYMGIYLLFGLFGLVYLWGLAQA